MQPEKFYEYIEFVSIGKEVLRMSPAVKNVFIVSIENLELVKSINIENIYFNILFWILQTSIRYFYTNTSPYHRIHVIKV